MDKKDIQIEEIKTSYKNAPVSDRRSFIFINQIFHSISIRTKHPCCWYPCLVANLVFAIDEHRRNALQRRSAAASCCATSALTTSCSMPHRNLSPLTFPYQRTLYGYLAVDCTGCLGFCTASKQRDCDFIFYTQRHRHRPCLGELLAPNGPGNSTWYLVIWLAAFRQLFFTLSDT